MTSKMAVFFTKHKRSGQEARYCGSMRFFFPVLSLAFGSTFLWPHYSFYAHSPLLHIAVGHYSESFWGWWAMIAGILGIAGEITFNTALRLLAALVQASFLSLFSYLFIQTLAPLSVLLALFVVFRLLSVFEMTIMLREEG